MTDFAININDKGFPEMSFNKSSGLYNNIFTSLRIKKGSFFQNRDFGSRLHLLVRLKNTSTTESLAREYCKEALQWLLDTGKATNINVETERDSSGVTARLKIKIVVTSASGDVVTYEQFLEVI